MQVLWRHTHSWKLSGTWSNLYQMQKKNHLAKVCQSSLKQMERKSKLLLHFNEECLLHVHPCYDRPLDQEQILHEYHDVFSGLGKLPGTYHIQIDPNAKPVQENPRPIPIKDDLKKKIEELESMGAIAKVTKATPWISNIWS